MAVPPLADRAEPFLSRVRAGLGGRTAELEQLMSRFVTVGGTRRWADARVGEPEERGGALPHWMPPRPWSPHGARATRASRLPSTPPS